MASRPAARPLLRALALALPWLVACESDSLKPPPRVDDLMLYTALELDHKAVVLSTAATYNTLRLVATPKNYRGDPLPGLSAPQFVSLDEEKVRVTAEGLLIAEQPTSQPVWVVATLTTENLRHRDSVLVQVTADDPPPVLASLSIHPLPGDSAKTAAGKDRFAANTFAVSHDTLRVRAANPVGDTIGGLVVAFRSSDTTIAQVRRLTNGGEVLGLLPGTVTLYATTTVYGLTKADTLPYRIGWPVKVHVEVGNPHLGREPGRFIRPDYMVGVGAHVRWEFEAWGGVDNAFFSEVNVTFTEAQLPHVAVPDIATWYNDGPTGFFCLAGLADCASGNFRLGGGTISFTAPPPYPPMFAIRKFTEPGTYDYQSTATGTRGRIVVVAE